jgi:hypothetical protein
MLFVIGHEYAHHYLKHLDKTISPKLKVFKSNEVKFYSYKQKDELEADRNAITKPVLNTNERSDLANGAFLFFYYLHIYETVREYMFPSVTQHKTHPEPVDRIHELRKILPDSVGYKEEEIKKTLEYYSSFKSLLIKEFLPFEVERIETYGSTYLPSYKQKLTHDRLLL